jgi:hypothetical protein
VIGMHKEIEGRDGLKRWHGGLLPPRSGGSFPPLLTGAEQSGWSKHSGESRWRCGSIMGVQRGAGECCGLINREVGLYDDPCRFGLVGHMGKLWLVR